MLPHLAVPWASGVVLIHSYSLCLALFLSVALVVLARWDVRDRRRAEVRSMPRVEAFLIGVPSAVVLGRAMEVWLDWPTYREAPLAALVAPDTPVAIYGAFVGGLLAALRLRTIGGSLAVPLDQCAPLMLAGECATRVGCFLQGCCFGAPTTLPWGVAFPPGSPAYNAQEALGLLPPGASSSLPVHPTQLYSAAAALGALAIVAAFRRRRPPAGAILVLTTALYAVSRFVIEIVRADPGRGRFGALSGPQLLSLLVAGAAVAAVPLVWRVRAPGRPATV